MKLGNGEERNGKFDNISRTFSNFLPIGCGVGQVIGFTGARVGSFFANGVVLGVSRGDPVLAQNRLSVYNGSTFSGHKTFPSFSFLFQV